MSPSPKTLVCPQCSLEVEGLERCPECGTPCVPEAALRLSPGPEGDASSYGDVVSLRDPFEGQHLVSLLESRRIPVMIRGGTDVALAAGWVDHGNARFGVLMVPEGRLAEARDLVEQFRLQADGAEGLDEEEFAALAERAGLEAEVGSGRDGEAPPRVLLLGTRFGTTGLKLLGGVVALAASLVAFRFRQLLVVAVLVGWGVYLLRSLDVSIRLDGRKRRARLWSPVRMLTGRRPVEASWEELHRVSVRRTLRGHRVALTGRSESGQPLELLGPVEKDAAAARQQAERAARYLALPLEEPPTEG